MATELFTGMTLRELIIDCAERWGCADESGSLADVPDDPAMFDKVKRKIVAGYKPVMPTFQGLISEEDVMRLLAYVKSLKADGGGS